MNTEKKLQLRAVGRLLCVVVFALLYAWGGMEMKWLRRFVAPVWLGVSMFVFSGNWRVFLQVPLLFGSLSLGYGAESLMGKIYLRAVYGVANSVTAGVHYFTMENPKRDFVTMISLNTYLVVGACVILGVWNPFPARFEETVMGFTIGMISMFAPKDKYANSD